MDEFVIGVLAAVVFNGVFDALVVAWLAGRRSKLALISWLDSDEADPYYDRIAERAVKRFDSRIQGIESKMDEVDSRMKEPIHFDGTALVSQTSDIVHTEVERLKSWYDGKRGVAVRAMKELGEGALDEAGKKLVESGVVEEGDIFLAELESMTVDPKFKKEHPYAALAIEAMKRRALGNGGLRVTGQNRAGRGEFG